MDVTSVEACHVCKWHVDTLALDDLVLLVEVKEIEAYHLDMLVILFQQIWVGVTFAGNKRKEFAFLSVVDDVHSLDKDIIDQLQGVCLDLVQCGQLGLVDVGDENDGVVVVDDTVLAAVGSVHLQDLLSGLGQEEE